MRCRMLSKRYNIHDTSTTSVPHVYLVQFQVYQLPHATGDTTRTQHMETHALRHPTTAINQTKKQTKQVIS